MLRIILILIASFAVNAAIGRELGPAASLVREKLAASWPRLGIIELGDGSGWVITRVTSATVSGQHVQVDFDVAPAAIPDPYPRNR